MRTVSRLLLLLFSFYDYRCRAVHSVTLCPVETMQAHHKNISPRIIAIHINTINVTKNPIASIIHAFMVDLGRFAPPSRTLFSLLHTAITYSIYLYGLFVKLFGTQIARGHNLFVLGPELFTFLGFCLLAVCLSFEFGLFAILRHRS